MTRSSAPTKPVTTAVTGPVSQPSMENHDTAATTIGHGEQRQPDAVAAVGRHRGHGRSCPAARAMPPRPLPAAAQPA